MATYNLNYSRLESLLDRKFAPGTENAIIEAIKDAGLFAGHAGHIRVDTESTSGAYTIPSGVQLFLDTGTHNSMTLTDKGHEIIAAGDRSNSIFDKGPGGDTLIGGAGADTL